MVAYGIAMLSKCVFLSFHPQNHITDFNKNLYERYEIDGHFKYAHFFLY